MNLSRRSLLTGLLSSAAVIVAASTRLRITVTDYLSPRYETFTEHFRFIPSTGIEDWRYCTRICNIETLEDYAKIDRALALEQIWGKSIPVGKPGRSSFDGLPPEELRWGPEDVT
jgi:hypothetical protein